MPDVSQIMADIEARLSNASPADRMYERPMTWDQARALLDEVTRLREERDSFQRVGIAAEAELARLRAPAGDELPDDLRAPLHSLQADREYLVARIQKADDEEAGLLSESIRDRLSQIEEAAYRLNARLRSPAGDGRASRQHRSQQ